MADQELGLILKTKSDVPEAMGKAKSATVSFAKQVDDIQKKFSTAFKDIALSYAAPLVILNSVINAIQASFEKNRQNMAEALRFAEVGESKFISAEARYLAAEKKRRDAEGNKGKAQMGEEELIKDFLKNDPRTAEIFNKVSQGTVQGLAQAQIRGTLMPGTTGEEQVLAYAVKNLEIRKAVKDIIKKDMSASGEPEVKQYFAPAGINAVVGMGNNAAMDAMNAQLEENRKQTALLQQIAQGGGNVPVDFTKGNPHEDGYGGQM